MFAWAVHENAYDQDKLGLTRFVSMADYYNLLYREEEREMLPMCRAEVELG